MKQIALLCVDILEETDPSGLMPEGDYYDAGLKLGESLDASSDVKEILDHMRNILAEPYDEEKAGIAAEYISERISSAGTFFIKGDLRYGSIAEIFCRINDEKLPKQLDLLDTWFKGMIVAEEESDNNTKKEAWFDDTELMIHACRYHDVLYSGTAGRISQITGRLAGTAKGNQEKERRTAELIRRKISDTICEDPECILKLQENVRTRLSVLDEERMILLDQAVFEKILLLISCREHMSSAEKREEYVSMHDDVYDDLVYNVAFQWKKYTFENLCNAWLWLLLGGLLRDECGRILHLFDSSFIPVRKKPSETGTLKDKICFLFYPERYEPVYTGDEADEEFPDIHFYCDRCGDLLNEQEGFHTDEHEWKCTKCGYMNRITWDEVYDYFEYIGSGEHVDAEQSEKAVEKRREELKNK